MPPPARLLCESGDTATAGTAYSAESGTLGCAPGETSTRTCPAERSAGHRGPDRRRPGGGARSRGHPPGPQARQRQGEGRQRRQGAGLRSRQGARGGARGRRSARLADDGDRRDPNGRHRGDGSLHVTRAGAGPARRPARRRVGVRRRRVRDAHGAQGVRGRRRDRHPRRGHQVRALVGIVGGRRAAGGVGRAAPLPGEGPRGPPAGHRRCPARSAGRVRGSRPPGHGREARTRTRVATPRGGAGRRRGAGGDRRRSRRPEPAGARAAGPRPRAVHDSRHAEYGSDPGAVARRPLSRL